MLGFQHFYVEVDDLKTLQELAAVYLRVQGCGSTASSTMPKERMIGVRLWIPDEMPSDVKLPWTLRPVPKLFPLLLVDTAWVNHPDPQYRPWFYLGASGPTYVLRPTDSYSALDQFLHQLPHYLAVHQEVWEEAWAEVNEPECDGHVEEGFTLSAGTFHGPLVIGRQYMEYHK